MLELLLYLITKCDFSKKGLTSFRKVKKNYVNFWYILRIIMILLCNFFFFHFLFVEKKKFKYFTLFSDLLSFFSVLFTLLNLHKKCVRKKIYINFYFDTLATHTIIYCCFLFCSTESLLYFFVKKGRWKGEESII